MSSNVPPDASPPPAAPDLTSSSRSWPRRHPWLTALGSLVVLVGIVSALGGGGSDAPTDVGEAVAISESAAPDDDATATPEPVETTTEATEPQPTETITVTAEPEPAETVTVAPEPAEPRGTASEDDAGDVVSDFVEGEYDADLEALAQACVDGGEADACWDLFLESPLDSEYEALGLEQSGDSAGLDGTDLGLDGADVDGSAILEILWDSMSEGERDLICFGWSLDPEDALDSFMDGADGMLSRSDARDFFDQTC